MLEINYERFCFLISLRCNLKCKLCAEHAPYRTYDYNPSTDYLKKELQQLFSLVHHIEKFDITGGEPFLRRDLSEIIDYIFQYHHDKIDMIRITTNGTLMPSEGFAKAAKKWKNRIHVIVDQYEASGNSSQIHEYLESEGISSEIRKYKDIPHCGGWVDYGDLSLKHSKKDAEALYHKCMVPKLGFFTCIANGYIYPCARARLLHENSIRSVTMSIFENDLTESGKKYRMKSLLGEEVVDACRYCNGLCEDSQRFIPAEQIMDVKGAKSFLEQVQAKTSRSFGRILIYTQTYNNEKTIARTIESVIHQTNGNFTYFICDNGSADRTGEIIRQYADQDSRLIHVRCEMNDIMGSATIRPLLYELIPKSVDPYVLIVDGDDSLELNFIEEAMKIIETDKPDMIVPAYNRIDAWNGNLLNRKAFSEDATFRGDKKKSIDLILLRPLLLIQGGLVQRWSSAKRVPYAFLNRYIFPEWFVYVDAIVNLNVFIEYPTVSFMTHAGYNYFVAPDSLCRSYVPGRIHSDEFIFFVYNDFLDQYGKDDDISRDYCYAIYYSLIETTLESIINARKIEEILDLLQSKVTQEMFRRKFNSIFMNLKNRSGFLDKIKSFVENLEEKERFKNLIDDILDELEKLRNSCNCEKNEMDRIKIQTDTVYIKRSVLNKMRRSEMKEFRMAIKEIESNYNSGIVERKRENLLEEWNGKQIILYGAGTLSNFVRDHLSEQGIKIAGFADTYRSGIHSQTGLPIISAETLKKEYDDAIVIITSELHGKSIMNTLKQIDYSGKVFSFDELLCFYTISYTDFAPFLDGYEWAYGLYEDAVSKKIILDSIRTRILGESMTPSKNPQYFEPDIFSLTEDEVFVDGGCFIGDTAEEFIRQTKGKYRHIYGFEPDEVNYAKAIANLSTYPNVDVMPGGLLYMTNTLRFVSGNFGNSHFSEDGDVIRQTYSMDEFFSHKQEKPSFVKMDVEGDELRAIDGAQNLLRDIKPKLAICVYHKLEDMYTIPQRILYYNKDYRLALRHYSHWYAESVCYAI